jgi:hypothetical protein
MTKINVFGKMGCAKCDTTKTKLRHFLGAWEMDHKVEMVFHDMDTVDGMAEGAFHDVDQIPSTIVENSGRNVARWDGEVPNSKRMKVVLHETAAV